MAEKIAHTIFAYDIGSEVYALSKWYDNGKETDHVAIYRAKVESWSYDGEEQKIMYYLSSPNGSWWGDSIESECVSSDFQEILEAAKKLWRQ